MSTRATVWILNRENGDERFLYHHCDGYGLDYEIDKVLKNLPDDKWTVDDIAETIVNYDEDYGRHHVDGIGWDSEYAYKIDVVYKTLEKFNCGISDTINGDRKDEKTQEKYLEETYRYSNAVVDDEAIIKIQLLELIRFACDCIEHGVVDGEKANKIQEIYKIIHK